MKKALNRFLLVLLILSVKPVMSQIDTVFWFAAPWVTTGHANNVPVVMRLSSFNNATTVRVRQPAGTFDTTFTIPANSLVSESLSHIINQIENKPANIVHNRGIKITSNFPITVVYEVVTNVNNPETYSMKGQNGLGLEFVCPFQTNGNNGGYSPTPKSQIIVVASESSTIIWITPRCNIIGHAANVTYSVALNAGQSYNIENLTRLESVPGQNLSGTIVVSNKPISVTVSDDSVGGVSGCFDLMGDQIVPVEVVGTEYIINKGGLNAAQFEGAYVVATQNFTQITINDGGITTVLLNKGDTYFYKTVNPLTYITGDKPVYVIHVSGFGCEMGEAILPPLNCAGSDQVSFTRTNSQTFILNILCKTTAINNFLLNGSSTLVPASGFTVVPGTSGIWSGFQKSYSSVEIPSGITNLLTNSHPTDSLFAMGVINGGPGTGCLYHYMSSFLRKVITVAGPDQNICTATGTLALTGNVEGGAIAGVWSTPNGSGTFGNANSFNTTYTLSPADLNLSNVKFVLTSVGSCKPTTDTIIANIFKSPIVDAGLNLNICKNNSSNIVLNGSLQYAAGGNWTSSGSGSFGNLSPLSVSYIPSPSDLNSDSVKIKFTSAGSLNGCPNSYDSLVIRFTPSPTVAINPVASVCANNATVIISGTVTGGSTTGIWSGGTGSYNPGTTSLTNTYVPTPTEIATGSVNIVLSSNNYGNCKQVKDSIQVSFTAAPKVLAGLNLVSCKNNATTALSGTITGITNTGMWSGGTGTFTPTDSTLNSLYSPSLTELSAGSVTLTLTSKNNLNCNQVKDTVVIKFIDPAIVKAGLDLTLCKNNPNPVLSGTVVGTYSTVVWSGGSGSYFPNNTSLTTTYTPNPAEISAGSATLILTSNDNGFCNQVVDTVQLFFTNAPVVNAGVDIFTCRNNISTVLSGTVTGTTNTGSWTGGSGTYDPDNSALTTTYTPSSVEVTAGSVTLTLVSTNNNNCNQVEDKVIINFSDPAVVFAGNNIVACKNKPNIALNGSVTGITNTGLWSGGTGTFTPGNTSLNSLYIPSNSELTIGSTTLILNSTNNSGCNQVTDTIILKYTNAPVVDAGLNVTICKNNAVALLNGLITGPTSTGVWIGGSGTYSSGQFSLTNVYSPSVSEISAGSATLVLQSTNGGNCNAVTDTLVITLTNPPVVLAGADISVCANNASVAINGTVTAGSTAGVWTTTGGGSFSPSTSSLTSVYNLDPSDAAQGSIYIKLTSINNGNCNAVSDSLIVTITPKPIVNAGLNDTICSSNIYYPLNGSVSAGSSTGFWSTTSNGNFANINNLSTIYTLGQADTTLGYVNIVLTSNGGNCLPETDTLKIVIAKSPLVNAGIDRAVCDNEKILLNGNVVGLTTTGVWSSLGTGLFVPDDSLLTTYYQPSQLDIANGYVNILLTSTYNKGCVAVKDTVKLTFKPAPYSDFNTNNVCSKYPASFTDVSIPTGSITGMWWDFGDITTSTSNNPTHTYVNPGTYTVTHVAYSSNGCKDTIKKEVEIYFLPQAQFYNSTSCVGNNTQFVDSSKTASGSIVQWQWYFGDNQTATIQNPKHGFASSSTYTVTLIATNSFGCKDTLQKNVTVISGPTANFSVTPNPAEALENVTFTDLSTGPASLTNWYWAFGDSMASNIQNPNHIYNTQGDLSVLLVVKDINGCIDTVRKDIAIVLLPDVPTAFSPNGDGQNDLFLVRGGPFKTINVRVYNNWGQLVFETIDQNIGWNGTLRGTEQPIGVFIWVVEVEMLNGKKIKKTGDVTLLR